jgi:hypothetical protein
MSLTSSGEIVTLIGIALGISIISVLIDHETLAVLSIADDVSRRDVKITPVTPILELVIPYLSSLEKPDINPLVLLASGTAFSDVVL